MMKFSLLALSCLCLTIKCTFACFGGGGFSIGIGTGGPFVSVSDSSGRTGTMDLNTLSSLVETNKDYSSSSGSSVSNYNSNNNDAELKFSENGIRLLKQREGFVAEIEGDIKDIPTIGYGTNCKAHPDLCTGLSGQRITEEKATELMLKEVTGIEKVIKDSVKVPLQQNEYDALISFTYHEGIGNFKSSTLLKKLNENDKKSAAEEFKNWNKMTNPKTGEKEIIPGFVNRRASEIEQFCKDGAC